MEYHVSIEQVAAQPLAVIRDRATRAELPVKIPAHCGTVWNFIRQQNLKSPGLMITVYLDDPNESLLARPGGVPIEVGAQVAAPFADSSPVMCSSTPAGTIAATTHIGPYGELGKAHEAVRAWCVANGKRIAGTYWELYDHPTDDPTKLRTDVSYLLR